MTVTVYSAPGCHKCDLTKGHMSKLGIAHKVVDISLDADAAARVKALGHSSLPVVVAGEQVWSDYRHDRIKDLAKQLSEGA